MTFVEVQELSRAFWGSRALLTAVELDVFTAVAAGAAAPEVAGRIGADPRATEMLLNALVALDLLTKTQGVFYNTEVAAQYLSDQSPRSRRAGLMHTVHLWDRWSTLTRTRAQRSTGEPGADIKPGRRMGRRVHCRHARPGGDDGPGTGRGSGDQRRPPHVGRGRRFRRLLDRVRRGRSPASRGRA